MIQLYHNPRCGKSREAVQWLEDKGIEFEIIRYMDEDLTFDEVDELVALAGFNTIDLIRTQEKVWKEEFADKDLDDNELIYAIIEYPQLLQRPIAIHGDRGVIARPAEKISEIL
jgi:arsenate reductase